MMAGEHPPMPFIVGVPRSGTTLLRLMLDSHPQLTIPPETGFLTRPMSWLKHVSPRTALFHTVTRIPFQSGPWRDFGLDAAEFHSALKEIQPFDASDGFRAFYRLYAQKQNKLRYGDKTPLYCQHLAKLEQILPEAHFIHIIRDGRDVALSLRSMWFAPGRDLQTLATYWGTLVQQTRNAGHRCQAYMEIRYEQLITDPEPALKLICDFLKLDFDSAMLHYWERSKERLREHKTRQGITGRVLVTQEERLRQQRLTQQPPQLNRISNWKNDMTPAEHAEFLRHAGAMLQTLHYEV